MSRSRCARFGLTTLVVVVFVAMQTGTVHTQARGGTPQPHVTPNSADAGMGEGIAVDAAGNIYAAEAVLRGITKYVKN